MIRPHESPHTVYAPGIYDFSTVSGDNPHLSLLVGLAPLFQATFRCASEESGAKQAW